VAVPRHAQKLRPSALSGFFEVILDDGTALLGRTVVIATGARQVVERAVGGLFIMIGADPCTGWLKEAVRPDDRGFVVTGEDCGADAPTPYNIFQTSLAGVFAVGDVRSGSVKRVASAVGEGSVVVQAVHARLASH